jgi:hypothetical protein
LNWRVWRGGARDVDAKVAKENLRKDAKESVLK